MEIDVGDNERLLLRRVVARVHQIRSDHSPKVLELFDDEEQVTLNDNMIYIVTFIPEEYFNRP
jgi:hypothetical protein